MVCETAMITNFQNITKEPFVSAEICKLCPNFERVNCLYFPESVTLGAGRLGAGRLGAGRLGARLSKIVVLKVKAGLLK